MKHLAAYMLLVLGGNDKPTEADIKNLMKAAGVAEDKDSLKCMMDRMSGQDVVKMTNDGMKKFAAMPSGGAAAAAPAGGAAAAPAKEAVKEVEEEEVDMDMGGLFGDDY